MLKYSLFKKLGENILRLSRCYHDNAQPYKNCCILSTAAFGAAKFFPPHLLILVSFQHLKLDRISWLLRGYTRSCPRTFTRPHFSVSPSHVLLRLPALLSAPSRALHYWDYYTISTLLVFVSLDQCPQPSSRPSLWGGARMDYTWEGETDCRGQ